jgi:hypothetical protein
MKKGAPQNAVIIPTGISVGAIIVLATVSEQIKKHAPNKAEDGSNAL